MQRLRDAIGLAGVVVTAVLSRRPVFTRPDPEWILMRAAVWAAKLIADAADELEASLIVMGSHGRSGISAVVMGSWPPRSPTTARARC